MPLITPEKSPKNSQDPSDTGKFIPLLIGFFFGPLGLHRIWLRRFKSGAYMLGVSSLALVEFGRNTELVQRIREGEIITDLPRGLILASLVLFITSVWATVDCVKLAMGKFADHSGRPITRW
jgi:hypothetical protein